MKLNILDLCAILTALLHFAKYECVLMANLFQGLNQHLHVSTECFGKPLLKLAYCSCIIRLLLMIQELVQTANTNTYIKA